MRGVSELARMTPEAVEARYGVSPARYPELAAIVGETSDNLPGVPGVGPGFAARWLKEYDGLDNVITHADKITGKKGEALREHLGDVIRNRQLNELVRDLDLELTPADLEAQSWDRQLVHTLFDSLEFRVLRERLLESWDVQHEPIDESGFELAGARPRPGRGGRVAGGAHRRGPGRTGVTIQGRWGSGTGEVWSVALAAADGTGAWFDAAEVTPEDDAAVMTWFDDPAHAKVLHDAKGPMLALAARGWPLRGLVSDTALAAYLARPDQRSYDLADLTLRYLKRELKQGATDDGQLTFDALDDAGLHRRRRHRDAARPRGGRPGRRARRRDRGARRQAAAGRRRAAAHRPARADGADRHRGRRRPPAVAGGATSPASVKLRRRGRRTPSIGKEINLGSPKQLQVVLFDELGMPKTKRTKTGYTTDADALQVPPKSRRHQARRLPLQPAAPPRRRPAAADHRGPAQDGRRPTAASTRRSTS